MLLKRKTVSRLTLLALAVAVGVMVPGCEDNGVAPCGWNDGCGQPGEYTQTWEETFDAGSGLELSIENFVGTITYETGNEDVIRVKATKKAVSFDDLGDLALDVVTGNSTLSIQARNPLNRKQASVDLEITAPAGVIPDIKLGVGEVEYRGCPKGNHRIQVGVGNVWLWLKAGLGVSVDLTCGVGSILLDFEVRGLISKNRVVGYIGTNPQGELQVHSGVGNLYLKRE